MYEHILIATDGTEFAAKGVEHELALAAALAAKATVLRVVEPLEREAAKEARAKICRTQCCFGTAARDR